MTLALLALLGCRTTGTEVDSADLFCQVFPDADGDGFGDAAGEDWGLCALEPGFVLVSGDCDDTDPAIHPDATEVCDGVDNECDGLIDDADPSLELASRLEGWSDLDGDGYGDPAGLQVACVLSDDAVDNALDCDDADAAVNPDAEELCDGVDSDCDGLADNGFPDADADQTADCVDVCPVYVAAGLSANGDGSEASPYASVADAIALRGGYCDSILLLPGTYAEAVDFGGEALSIASTEGPAVTVLDASGLDAPVVRIEGVAGGLLEGLTLTGGAGALGDDSTFSGFLQGSLSSELRHGAGLYVRDASPTLRDLIVEDNGASGYGGGLLGHGFDGALEDSVIRRNTADGRFHGGGGVWLYASAATLSGNQIDSNAATGTGASGGGLAVLDSEAQVLGNLFTGNRADDLGHGALYSSAGGLFANNVLSAHTEGVALAVLDESPVDVLHNTLDANLDGLFVDGANRRYPTGAYLNNLITRSLDDGVDVGWYACLNTIHFDYNDVWGSVGADYSNATCETEVKGSGYHNLSVDPLYVDADGGDWSLHADSPVKDAGEDASAYGVSVDILGAARPSGSGVSMGAYER